MSPVPPQPLLKRRLRDTYLESRERVRRAHERAEAAGKRSRELREGLRANRASHRTGLAERAFEASERSAREKERFVAVVSHELRQPLNAVLAALQLFERGGREEVAEKARLVMHRQLMQMSRLLDDLLDMSRLSMQSLKLKMSPFDLRSAVEAAAETVAGPLADSGQRLTVRLPEHPVVVHGDAARLQQVFANLFSNAVRYTPPGGSVGASLRDDGGWAVAEVSDTGHGIDAWDLERIFEPFRRGGGSGVEGFGIGLTVVRGLVELHGGSVTAESAGRDRGSTFVVRVPTTAARQGAQP